MIVSRSARRRQASRASGWVETSLQARHIACSCSSVTEGVENNLVRSSSGFGSAPKLGPCGWYSGTPHAPRVRRCGEFRLQVRAVPAPGQPTSKKGHPGPSAAERATYRWAYRRSLHRTRLTPGGGARRRALSQPYCAKAVPVSSTGQTQQEAFRTRSLRGAWSRPAVRGGPGKSPSHETLFTRTADEWVFQLRNNLMRWASPVTLSPQ